MEDIRRGESGNMVKLSLMAANGTREVHMLSRGSER